MIRQWRDANWLGRTGCVLYLVLAVLNATTLIAKPNWLTFLLGMLFGALSFSTLSFSAAHERDKAELRELERAKNRALARIKWRQN